MTHPSLEIRAVSHDADGSPIVDCVSWCVARGEHWAVLGPNGAGKTTLLKIAAGYLWPNAGGDVVRDGEGLTDVREMRRRIGWVSTVLNREIPAQETVLDTIVSGKFAQIGLQVMAWDPPRADDYARAEFYLHEINCLELRDKRFGILSQGEQQKVLIARARMTEPLLIILDEPCAGLDPAAREIFLASLEHLATQPTAPSLVFVTHHIEEIMPAFALTLALRAGRVLRSGPTHEILNADLVSELYGTRIAHLVHHNGRLWPIW